MDNQNLKEVVRREEIYALAIGGMTYEKIGRRYGISRQRAHQIAKSTAKKMGKPLNKKQAKYACSAPQFYVTEEQDYIIESTPGKTYSEKMRTILGHWVTGGRPVTLKLMDRPEDVFPVLKGGFWYTSTQDKALKSAPGKSKAQKLRYVINYYKTTKG